MCPLPSNILVIKFCWPVLFISISAASKAAQSRVYYEVIVVFTNQRECSTFYGFFLFFVFFTFFLEKENRMLHKLFQNVIFCNFALQEFQKNNPHPMHLKQTINPPFCCLLVYCYPPQNVIHHGGHQWRTNFCDSYKSNQRTYNLHAHHVFATQKYKDMNVAFI